MKNILSSCRKDFWLSAVALATGFLFGVPHAFAQTAETAPATPGSAVDKGLLGKWAVTVTGRQEKVVSEISTAMEAFAQLRKSWSLPSTWQPQANDAVMLDEKGNSGGLIKCLNLKSGAILLLEYAHTGPDKFLVAPPSLFLPNEETSSLVMDNFTGKPLTRATKVLSEAEMKKPEHFPGGLVDPALLGKWMWEVGRGQPPEYVEISTSEDAFKQYVAPGGNGASLGPSWQAPPNVAIFRNPTHKYTTVLQSYDLADGSKLIWIWGPELLCYRYVKISTGIELTTLGLLANEVTHLRPANPGEIQESAPAEKATMTPTNPGNGKNPGTSQTDSLVRNNLRTLFSAALQYMAAKGTPQANYSDMITIPPVVVPIEGEDYTHLTLTQTQTEMSIVLPDGREIKFDQ